MPNSRALPLVLSALVASGCGRGPAESSAPLNANTAARAGGATLAVRAGESPAGPDSREPELRATADGRLIRARLRLDDAARGRPTRRGVG
ncbi:MAG: hypothetical protein LC800_07790 [Acidobacteria bacterium]|nr:hypothetical protein [Acidobacteriota bacterium]